MNPRKFLNLILCMSLSGCLQRPPLKTGLEGKELPSFPILLMDSITAFNTSNIQGGKAFVIFYFSPECPYCRAQVTDLIKHQKEFENISFYLLSSYPYRDVKGFFGEFGLDKIKNITTGIDYTNSFSNYLYVPSVPYLAIYNKEKRLKQVLMGRTEYKRLISLVNQ